MAYQTTGRRAMTVPQILAAVIGAIYTIIGVAGFFVTGFDNFASEEGESLLGFHVNPLHNIVHLVIGLAGLAMSRRLNTARTYGWLLFIGYGAVFIYGLIVDKNSDANFLALNGADDVLHLVSSLAGLLTALWPVRRAMVDRSTTTTTTDTHLTR
jgi:uncharacterized membrane protein YuzA (DUF378 family)